MRMSNIDQGVGRNSFSEDCQAQLEYWRTLPVRFLMSQWTKKIHQNMPLLPLVLLST